MGIEELVKTCKSCQPGCVGCRFYKECEELRIEIGGSGVVPECWDNQLMERARVVAALLRLGLRRAK